MIIYLNGEFVEKEQAKISIFDHGLLYGDGVFEGIRSYSGRVFKFQEHMDRLYDSARAIMLEIPLTKEAFKNAILETLKRNNLKDVYIRVVVTRGVGDLGLDPRKCPKPFVFIIADKIVLYADKFYKEGLDVVTVSVRRNIPEAVNPRIKSLNYLNNILAKIEANAAGVLEAIMLDKDGYVAECTGDNIFIIKNGKLITPPLYIGVLDGITRETVIEIAGKMKIPAEEKTFTRYDIYTADECFLTGTAAEIIPVVKVDSRKIGDGTPGKITLKLIESFKRITSGS